MKTLQYAAIGALMAGMAFSPVYGASAKFAAHAMEEVNLISTNQLAGPTSYSMESWLKTANKKDLLIGVSLEVGLYTDTEVKGKNGDTVKDASAGGIRVTVTLDGIEAAPGPVIFSQRYQELSATLGGVIESCDFTVDLETGEGSIDISEDCIVTDEMIRLILSTTAAHHFNFVYPDVEPGTHHVQVSVEAMTPEEVINGSIGVDPTTATANDKGWAVVGKGSLTVQEVQAVNLKDSSTEGSALELY